MPASSSYSLARLLDGYCLAARSEAKSPKTIDITICAVTRLENACLEIMRSSDVRQIGPNEIRAFIVQLRESPRFGTHPKIPLQGGNLSPFTVSCYLRSIRAFWSWLVAEEIVEVSPFTRVKIPKPPKKIIPTFSPAQFQSLISVIDASTPDGYRDIAFLTVLLDTGLRVSELTNADLADLNLEDGSLKVFGKGTKERVAPLGRRSRNLLWNYIARFRPEPAAPRIANIFLNSRGGPLNKNYVEAVMKRHGRTAGIDGVRCSPHTLRHSAAVMFLRNGGDVFTLQRLLGHATLEMTRHYCELADIDVKVAHRIASPADNLPFDGIAGRQYRPISTQPGRRPSTKYLPAPQLASVYAVYNVIDTAGGD